MKLLSTREALKDNPIIGPLVKLAATADQVYTLPTNPLLVLASPTPSHHSLHIVRGPGFVEEEEYVVYVLKAENSPNMGHSAYVTHF